MGFSRLHPTVILYQSRYCFLNTGNVCWFQVFIRSTDFCQFYINCLFLLCFWKIIFPSKFLCCCLFICTWINCSQMFNPDSSYRVFNHITNNPVRSEKLCCCRYSLFCDFYILFQFCKSIIF